MRNPWHISVTAAMLFIVAACEPDQLPTSPPSNDHSITALKQTTKTTKWASLSPSAQLTCGLTTQGKAYCWGLNNYGQLGTGSTDYVSWTPQAVAGNHQFSEIAIAYKHACGIASGQMYCWGHNDRGQLGNPITTVMSREPIPVQGDLNFSHVAVGFSHTCAIGTRAGSIYTDIGFCWGDNSIGQMGNNTYGDYQDTPTEIWNESLVRDPFTNGFDYLQLYWIESGGLGTCGLTEGYDPLFGVPTNHPSYIVCWGYNDHYMFGTTSYNAMLVPTISMESLSPTTVELSLFNTSACAIASSLTMGKASYCWGGGGSGEIGDGTTDFHPEPTMVDGPGFVSISTGSGHSCGITSKGDAYCWGSNVRGQLGNGTHISSLVPVLVSGGIKFKEIYAAGANPDVAFTCGLTTKGEAYCWGGNELGELGDGTNTDRSVPTAVIDPI